MSSFLFLIVAILINKTYSMEESVKKIQLNDSYSNLYVHVNVYNSPKNSWKTSFNVGCNDFGYNNDNYLNGYEYAPGLGYYKYYPELVSWHMAVKQCERDKAHLVIINSQPEHDFLVKLITDKQINQTTKVNYVHIGFHDQYVEGQYLTIFDEPLCISGFYKWRQNQPDNARNNENCGSLYKEGLLNDIGCFNTNHFICEI